MPSKWVREPGDPIPEVLDVSDEFGDMGGALLIGAGPDWITAPAGLKGAEPGERLPITERYEPPADNPLRCPHPQCQRFGIIRKFSVRSASGTDYRVLECVACKQFLWGSPRKDTPDAAPPQA